MAGKRAAKIPKNDFEYDEGEVCGFSSEAPLTGDCISSLSFDDDSDIYNIQTNSECKSINDNGAYKNTLSSTKDIFNNRKTSLPNGAVAAYFLIRLEKQFNNLSSSINKLNTIISTKLGVVIDSDGSGDDSHKVA
nr:YvrJ family protein [Clostridium beijerinckii]